MNAKATRNEGNEYSKRRKRKWTKEKREEVIETLDALRERLSRHTEDMRAMQDMIYNTFVTAREELNVLEERISREFEERFEAEDERVQKAMTDLLERAKEEEEEKEEKEGEGEEEEEGEEDLTKVTIEDMLQKAKAALISEQKYHLSVKPLELGSMAEFTAESNLAIFTPRTPTDLKVRLSSDCCVEVEFSHLNPDEQRVVTETGITDQITYVASMRPEGDSTVYEYPISGDMPLWFQFDCPAIAGSPHEIRVKALYRQPDCVTSSEWSEPALLVPTFADCCIWARPHEDTAAERMYELLGRGTVRKLGENGYTTTVTAAATLPPNVNLTWDVTVKKAHQNKGKGVYVGVAPYDVDPNESNQKSCGWYMYCFNQTLWSGPPFGYRSRRFEGTTGSSFQGEVRLFFNSKRRPATLSVKLKNSPTLHLAYKNIPMDKPLVPAVVIEYVDTVVSIAPLETSVICLD